MSLLVSQTFTKLHHDFKSPAHSSHIHQVSTDGADEECQVSTDGITPSSLASEYYQMVLTCPCVVLRLASPCGTRWAARSCVVLSSAIQHNTKDWAQSGRTGYPSGTLPSCAHVSVVYSRLPSFMEPPKHWAKPSRYLLPPCSTRPECRAASTKCVLAEKQGLSGVG